MKAKILLLVDKFINCIHLNSILLNEVFTLKVLITWKKLMNIMDKSVIYQLLECVLSNVIIILLQKIIQKNFGISIEKRIIIDQE